MVESWVEPAISASVAGITVIVNGSGPGNRPYRSPKPNRISENV